MLLLDVGNTRLKWRLLNNGAIVQEGSLALADINSDLWAKMSSPGRILGSCVAAQTVQDQLNGLCEQHWKLAPEWFKVEASCAGLTNGYDVQKLGPDRWAAVIAAFHRVKGAVIVVSAGTAITVDAVTAQGHYLGGLILPGLHLMRQALAEKTARLPLADGAFRDFPTQTDDAIYSGAIDAACGAIERLARRLGSIAPCVLSGGDASVLASQLPLEVISVDNLVLDGLQVIAR